MRLQSFKKTIVVYKFVLIILLSIFVFWTCVLTSNVFAKDKQTIKVGYCNDDPIIILKQNGDYSGYGYDYLMEIAKYTNWDYKFIQGTQKECLDRLKNGEINIVLDIESTPELVKDYGFSTYEFSYNNSALYTYDENQEFCYKDYKAFHGMRVGMLKENLDKQSFIQYSIKNKFYVSFDYFEDAKQLTDALFSGKVDAIVAEKLKDSKGVKAIDQFCFKKTFCITNKSSSETLNQLNYGMEQVLNNDLFFTLKLYHKYYNNSVAVKVDFTREERDYIEVNPILRLVGNPDLLPLEFYNSESKEFEGINADLIQDIARYSGFKIEYIQTDSYEQSKQYFKQGKADLMSAQEQQLNSFSSLVSKPYNEMETVIIGKTSKKPQGNYIIGVPTWYKIESTQKDIIPKNAKLHEYKDIEKMLLALKQGEVQAVAVNVHTLQYLLQSKQYGELRVIDYLNVKSTMCLGVNDKVDPIVVSIINKSIQHISSQDVIAATINNTIDKAYDLSLKRVFAKYSGVFVIGIIIIAALVMVLMIYGKMKTTRRLRQIAYVDDVTGESTIEKFRLDCKSLFSKYGQECYSLVYFDIERFKYINDTYGHNLGNELLCHVAKRTREVLYDFETLARLSADNFVILLKNQDKKEIIETLQRLQRNIQSFEVLSKANYNIVLSIGIYFFTNEKTSFFIALDKANMARKSIKGQHSCSIAFYDEQMNQKLIEEVEIVKSMQMALANGEFKAYMQPKFDLTNEKIVGAEALVRWCNPNKGVIPPDRFIPLFESNGFITQVDFCVFEQVCKLLQKMLKNNYNVVPISVNLSRVHMQSSDFVQKLCLIAKKYNVPTNLLEIELTETITFQNVDEISKILNQLKSKGFILSMDDFGAGYSSLNILKSLPFDILKIDRLFFNAEHATLREKIIIKNVVTMAHHLKMKVVCEGVETLRQAQLLKEIYCDIAQGYLYAKPMPIEDFLNYLKKT